MRQLVEDNCGQTCIAIIAGISQWDAVHAVGNDHGTQPKHLQEALFRFGFNVERKRFVKAEWPPPLAIALVRSKHDKGYGHAVVVRDGKVIDPAQGDPIPEKLWLTMMIGSGRHVAGLIVVNGKR
jgi:UTP-glucose-1-phosphate uridylyltransferase